MGFGYISIFDSEFVHKMTTLSKAKNVIFDLDGTLVDPLEGITASYRDVFDYLGVDFPDVEVIKSFIGPNIETVLRKNFSLEGLQLDNAISIFRGSYGNRFLFNYQKYPGIDEVLHGLMDSGKSLFVATSKLQTMASELIHHAGWSGIFSSIAGVQPAFRILTKYDVIENLVGQFDLEPEFTVMVGDRDADLESARALRMHSIGVLWGYGTREELALAAPNLMISQTSELGDLFD